MKRTRYQHVFVYIKDGETKLLNHAKERARADTTAEMTPNRVVFHSKTPDADRAAALECLGLSEDRSMVDDMAFSFPDSYSGGEYAKILFQGPER